MASRKPYAQYAALPYIFVDGDPRVLLVTALESGRWIIPKGWSERKAKPHEQTAVAMKGWMCLSGHAVFRTITAAFGLAGLVFIDHHFTIRV